MASAVEQVLCVKELRAKEIHGDVIFVLKSGETVKFKDDRGFTVAEIDRAGNFSLKGATKRV